MGEFVDGCMGEWVDGCMGGWVNGWMDGWVNGWMGEWVDGWMGGWGDGWMGGWVDGWMGGELGLTQSPLLALPIALGSPLPPLIRGVATAGGIVQSAETVFVRKSWELGVRR